MPLAGNRLPFQGMVEVISYFLCKIGTVVEADKMLPVAKETEDVPLTVADQEGPAGQSLEHAGACLMDGDDSLRVPVVGGQHDAAGTVDFEPLGRGRVCLPDAASQRGSFPKLLPARAPYGEVEVRQRFQQDLPLGVMRPDEDDVAAVFPSIAFRQIDGVVACGLASDGKPAGPGYSVPGKDLHGLRALQKI